MARESVAEFFARGGRVTRVAPAGTRRTFGPKVNGRGKVVPGHEKARRATAVRATRIDRARRAA